MEDILGNTGPVLQFFNYLLENFEIGLQLSVLYSEPFFLFLLRTTEIRSLAGVKINGNQTNPSDVILQKREVSAFGSFHSCGGLRLSGRNHERYRLLVFDSGQLYRRFGRRLSKLLSNNTA